VMMQMDGEWLFKIQSLLFIPATNPESGMIQPVLEPGWTLNYEMFFYVVFALTLFLKESVRFLAIALVFVGLTLVSWFGEANRWTDFYGRPLILEFLLGMAIARFGVRLPVIALPFGVAAMLLMTPLGIDRLYWLGIPAALIVAGALNYEDRLPHWRVADLLGSASYSIYLFHLLALGFVVKYWADAEASKAMFVTVSLGAAIIIGCGIYWALERPIIAFFAARKIKQTEKGVVAA
jgi:exopolysaccharide production protein ExoZ